MLSFSVGDVHFFWLKHIMVCLQTVSHLSDSNWLLFQVIILGCFPVCAQHTKVQNQTKDLVQFLEVVAGSRS